MTSSATPTGNADRTRTLNQQQPGRHQVFVVELDDGFGPRRVEERPNLFVGITTNDPAAHFARIKAGSKRYQAIREHGVRLRPDLTRNYGPNTEPDAKRQKRKLTEKLMRRISPSTATPGSGGCT